MPQDPRLTQQWLEALHTYYVKNEPPFLTDAEYDDLTYRLFAGLSEKKGADPFANEVIEQGEPEGIYGLLSWLERLKLKKVPLGAPVLMQPIPVGPHLHLYYTNGVFVRAVSAVTGQEVDASKFMFPVKLSRPLSGVLSAVVVYPTEPPQDAWFVPLAAYVQAKLSSGLFFAGDFKLKVIDWSGPSPFGGWAELMNWVETEGFTLVDGLRTAHAAGIATPLDLLVASKSFLHSELYPVAGFITRTESAYPGVNPIYVPLRTKIKKVIPRELQITVADTGEFLYRCHFDPIFFGVVTYKFASFRREDFGYVKTAIEKKTRIDVCSRGGRTWVLPKSVECWSQEPETCPLCGSSGTGYCPSSDCRSKRNASFFQGKTFALIGAFPHTHAELTSRIEAMGGVVKPSVSAATNYVIATYSPSESMPIKLQRAQALKVPILEWSAIRGRFECPVDSEVV